MLSRPSEQEIEELRNNLSYYMYKGSEVAKKTGEKTIYVVGQSRVGKSTFFNNLVGVRLKGTKVKKFEVCYVPDFQGAESKFSFKSVTILPNIQNVDYKGNKFALQDMAGFNDKNRNYLGAFMVSYMLVETFRYVENAKFILVCEEANITQSQIDQIIKPFMNFVNMFKGTELLNNDEVVRSLMSSVSFVVSKCDKSEDFILGKLEWMLEGLMDQEDKTVEKKLIIQLLKKLIEHKKIFLFKAAKDGEYAPQSTLFHDMEDKNWQWFNFKASQNLVEIPFARDFKNLKPIDQEKYLEFQQDKLKLYEGYSKVMKRFIDKSISQSSEVKIEYFKEFQELVLFSRNNDKFHDDQTIQTVGIDMTKPQISTEKSISGLTLIKKLNKIYQIVENISLVLETMTMNQKLRYLKSQIKKIMGILMEIFCHTRKEEIIFMKSIFIFLQSIEEFACMNDVQRSVGAEAVEQIKDSFLSMMPEMYIITTEFILKCELEEDILDQIEEKIHDLLNNHSEDLADSIMKLKQKLISVKIMKGSCKQKKKQYVEAINGYLGALQSLEQMKQTEENSEDLQKLYNCKIIEIYSRLGSCLREMKSFEMALTLYERICFVLQMNKCYEIMIQEEKSQEKLYKYMLRHGSFCEKYGRKPDAIKIYQKMLEIFYENPEEIIKKLEQCEENQNNAGGFSYRKTVAYDEDLIEKIKSEQETYENKNSDKTSIYSLDASMAF